MTALTPMQTTRALWALGFTIVFGGLAGCGVVHPMMYTADYPVRTDPIYACVTRRMTTLGYVVTVPDSATGARVGDRAQTPGPTNNGRADHDRLTAFIIAADSARLRLQVIASSMGPRRYWFQTRMENLPPTDAVRGDAVTVMRGCAFEYRILGKR